MSPKPFHFKSTNSIHSGKESACNVGDLDLIPGLGRSPGEGNSYPLQYSGLENSQNDWATFTFTLHLYSVLVSHLDFFSVWKPDLFKSLDKKHAMINYWNLNKFGSDTLEWNSAFFWISGSSVQFSSVQSLSRVRFFATPWINSTPGLPVHHQLPEFTQTHIHWVSDAIQPSYPLSSPSPPIFNRAKHQGLLQWVNSSHEVAKILEFQWISGKHILNFTRIVKWYW